MHVLLCKSWSQRRAGGGGRQSGLFTVSRRANPTVSVWGGSLLIESGLCPPIPLSYLLELGKGAPAAPGLGAPQQKAGRQVERLERGRKWGEAGGTRGGLWVETGRARRPGMQREDLWREEDRGEGWDLESWDPRGGREARGRGPHRWS